MFADYLNTPVAKRTTDSLGQTLSVKPEGFLKMLTYNDVDRRFSNPWLVAACQMTLQQHANGAEVVVTEVHLERNSLLKLDQENRQLSKVTDEELLNAPIENLVGRRAIIKMEVQGWNEDYVPAIAISLSELGEEIAFGGSVSVCNNFTILSSDHHFSTYSRHSDRSRERMSTQELLNKVSGLFPKAELILKEDLSLIESLKAQAVTVGQWNEFLGELFTQIHWVNRKRLNRQIASVPDEIKSLPITARMLANISAEAVEPAHPVYAFVDGMTNKWNCINYGTEQVKTEHGVSPKAVLETNANWTQLILDQDFSKN